MASRKALQVRVCCYRKRSFNSTFVYINRQPSAAQEVPFLSRLHILNHHRVNKPDNVKKMIHYSLFTVDVGMNEWLLNFNLPRRIISRVVMPQSHALQLSQRVRCGEQKQVLRSSFKQGLLRVGQMMGLTLSLRTLYRHYDLMHIYSRRKNFLSIFINLLFII